jgi:hypothetical protein
MLPRCVTARLRKPLGSRHGTRPSVHLEARARRPLAYDGAPTSTTSCRSWRPSCGPRRSAARFAGHAGRRPAARRGGGAAGLAELGDLGTPEELSPSRCASSPCAGSPAPRRPARRAPGADCACNFACAHCYSRSGRRSPDELTVRELEALVDHWRTWAARSWSWAAASPSCAAISPGWSLRRRLGVDSYVHTTEGRSPARAARARRDPSRGAGGEPGRRAGRDQRRGPRPCAFRRALEGIRLLRRHYPPGFNLSMAVGPGQRRGRRGDGPARRAAGRAGAAAAPDLPRGPGGERARARLRPAHLRPRLGQGPRAGAQERSRGGRPGRRSRRAAGLRGLRLRRRPHRHRAPPTGDVSPPEPARGLRGRATSASGPCWTVALGGGLPEGPAQRPGRECAACPDYDSCRGGCRVRALHAGRGLGGPTPGAATAFEPRAALAVPSSPLEQPKRRNLSVSPGEPRGAQVREQRLRLDACQEATTTPKKTVSTSCGAAPKKGTGRRRSAPPAARPRPRGPGRRRSDLLRRGPEEGDREEDGQHLLRAAPKKATEKKTVSTSCGSYGRKVRDHQPAPDGHTSCGGGGRKT